MSSGVEGESAQALDLLEQAIERDPRYGPALAWPRLRACGRLLDVTAGAKTQRRTVGRLSISLERALEAAGDDPGVLVNAASCARRISARTSVPMMALVDRALALNPSFAAWLVYQRPAQDVGRANPTRAVEHVETALRLSPRARIGGSFVAIGLAHFLRPAVR